MIRASERRTISIQKRINWDSEKLKAFYERWKFRDATGKLINYMDKWKYRVHNLDYDCFIVVVGGERKGKTTLTEHLAQYLTDGTLKASDFALTPDQFMMNMVSSKKGQAVIFDEAGTGLYSAETMNYQVRKLAKAFMVAGIKNAFVFLCIPDFFSLHKYIRNHRINLLFYVPKRGKMKVYSKLRAKNISLYGAKEKKMEVTYANAVGIFSQAWVNPEVEIQYRKMERKAKLGYLQRADPRDNMLSLTDIAKMTGLSEPTLYRHVQSGKLVAKKLNSKWFAEKDEVTRYIASENLMDLSEIEV